MDKVVRLRREGSIAFVALEEKEYKNTFTLRLINGLKDVFNTINSDNETKVVVVHGYDQYFCCGGTKDELIGLFNGAKSTGTEKINFSNFKFYDILLQCKVPVISAMQGHALGGGLAFGCYADIIIMAEECIYSANFMKYGFTPGMGATYIIPKKFGELLGNEMLISAKNYFGNELKERGANSKIVKKNDVIKVATEMAREIADKPLLALKELKKNINRNMIKELSSAIEMEVEMHNLTFKQLEVLNRIEKLF